MSKNNFTNENEFDFKFDIYDDIPEPVVNPPLPINIDYKF